MECLPHSSSWLSDGTKGYSIKCLLCAHDTLKSPCTQSPAGKALSWLCPALINCNFSYITYFFWSCHRLLHNNKLKVEGFLTAHPWRVQFTTTEKAWWPELTETAGWSQPQSRERRGLGYIHCLLFMQSEIQTHRMGPHTVRVTFPTSTNLNSETLIHMPRDLSPRWLRCCLVDKPYQPSWLDYWAMDPWDRRSWASSW